MVKPRDRICPIERLIATLSGHGVTREECLCVEAQCEWWSPYAGECSVKMAATGLRCALVSRPGGGMALRVELLMRDADSGDVLEVSVERGKRL
jgi:hypothetical protein